MRLKEINPGMVIHCKNDEEKKALLEEAERLGHLWYGTKMKPTENMDVGNTIHFYLDKAKYKYITHSGKIGGNVTEFSDLILPELTAEEVLQIASEICKNTSHCADCPIHGNCYRDCDSDKGKVVEVLCKWKSDHDKKEPEIETVDICRIIEIQPDGRKRCVHEEDLASGSTDAEIKIMVEAELKRYCMEHEGEFIAVHEVVSRVKAVE